MLNKKQADQPPPIPAAFSSQQSRVSYLALLADGHRDRGREAQEAETEIARLEAEIAGDAGEYERLRQEIDKVAQRIEGRQKRVKEETDIALEKRVAEGDLARLLVAHGAPEPAPAPKGGKYGDPPQTGAIAAVATQMCQACGQPMAWDEKQGYIHPVEGGFVLAGESCHFRRQADAQALPTGAEAAS